MLGLDSLEKINSINFLASQIQDFLHDQILLIEDCLGLNYKNSITSYIITPDYKLRRITRLPDFNNSFIDEIKEANFEESLIVLEMILQKNYHFQKLTSYRFA